MKHLWHTDVGMKIEQLSFSDGWSFLMWLRVQAGDSGSLRFGPVHERFDPNGAIYEFRCGYNVLHPTIFHLREETKSSYFCVRNSTEEEHQRCSVLPLLAWKKIAP